MRSFLTTLLIFLLGFTVFGAEEKFTASDAASGDQFGFSVAISGDFFVVGAQGDDSRTGAAYVFYRHQLGANQWGELIKLIASTPEEGARFGKAVDIDGDYIVVGAPRENSETGAAYVFYRNQGGINNWGQVAKLVASDGATEDQFGTSVAIYGDFVVVGAEMDDHSTLTDAGAAYIFNRNQGGADAWGEVTKLTASDPIASHFFGSDVDIYGDYIAVGAYGDSDIGTQSGAIYMFYRNQGGPDAWGELVKRIPTDGGVSLLGRAVALDGNFLVGGATKDDDLGGVNVTASGAIYVYEQNTGGADNWGFYQKLKAGDPQVEARLGEDVAISGNYIIGGAAYYDEGATADVGALYSYLLVGGTWIQQSKTVASDFSPSAIFGVSVAIAGNDAFAGAWGDNSETGAVYKYESINDLSLPVTFASFNAINWQGAVKLEWITESEVDNVGFKILRSVDDPNNYQLIASYETLSSLKGQMNSNSRTVYSYIDKNVTKGHTYYYKLVDVDINGETAEFGPIVYSTREQQSLISNTFNIIPAYPNPFNPEIILSLEVVDIHYQQNKLMINIYDVAGKLVKNIFNGNVTRGTYTFRWNGVDESGQLVPAGLYIVQYSLGKHKIHEKILFVK